MAKEWILNMATNKWGLNEKNSVGPVSQFYYKKLANFLRKKNIPLLP